MTYRFQPVKCPRMPTAVAMFAIFLTTSLLAATTLYVDGASGSDTGVCASEVSPCASIQYAVNRAVSGDSILVAEGTYTYDASADPCPSDHTAVVCVMNKNLTIRGGFGGGNWLNPDPSTRLTVIDGETSNRGVLVTGPRDWASLVMEGFTVQRGFGLPTANDINGFGGGVSCVLADLTLRNMVIKDNNVQGSDTDSEEGGSGAGGGVAIRSNSSSPLAAVVLEDLMFEGNQAIGGTGPVRGGYGQGGGLWMTYANATGADLVFRNNSAIGGSSDGDGILNGMADGQGAAVAFKLASSSTFQNVTSTENTAVGGDANSVTGSAGSAFGAGIYGEGATLISITDAEVRDNTVLGGNADKAGHGFGGGVYSIDSTVSLNRARVINNEARGGDGPTKKGSAGGGGALFSDHEGANGQRTITMVNTIIADNSVFLGVGGGTTSGGGGGVFLNGSQAEMWHCTVAGNSISGIPVQGRAFVIITRSPTTTPVGSNLKFNYGVISDHSTSDGDAALHVKLDSSVTFDTGLFANNGLDTAGAGTFNGLGTMINVPSIIYNSPGSPNFDYRLLPQSPAVDAATGSSEIWDFEGEARDSAPDLGADELTDSLSLIFADGFESGDTSAWQ